jgi:hypothetical protein
VEQRRYSIGLATYDHVLVIDADEALSEELRASILEVKRNWTHDGYDCNRLNSICGRWIRHSGWYPDRKLRLFDRRKASVKGRKHLRGDLLHYTYDGSRLSRPGPGLKKGKRRAFLDGYFGFLICRNMAYSHF